VKTWSHYEIPTCTIFWKKCRGDFRCAVWKNSVPDVNTMTFDDGNGGTIPFLRVSLTEGSVFIQWDDPTVTSPGLPGPDTDLDLHVFNAGTATLFGASTTQNINSGRPSEFVSDTVGTFDIVIQRTSGPPPGLIKILFSDDDAIAVNFNQALLSSGTTIGHANANGAIAVGAAAFRNTPGFGVSPAIQRSSSSAGGVPILFDVNGQRLAVPELRDVPAFVSVDSVCTNFFATPDDTDPNCFNFFGTGAAAANAAGVAALMLQVNPTLTPGQIRAIMMQSSEDMNDIFTPGLDVGFDSGTGQGFLNALKAVNGAAAATPAPTPSPTKKAAKKTKKTKGKG
jgi:Subtilase family